MSGQVAICWAYAGAAIDASATAKNPDLRPMLPPALLQTAAVAVRHSGRCALRGARRGAADAVARGAVRRQPEAAFDRPMVGQNLRDVHGELFHPVLERREE